MISPPVQNTPVGKEESPPGVLLYLPFHRLPENSGEMLDRLSSVCDIQAADLRYKLVGRGIARLTPTLPFGQQEALAGEMNDMGIPAALVAEKQIRQRISLPLARRVEITDTEIVFFDRDDTPVFTVDKTVDLLVVAADLSGRAVDKPYIGPMGQATVPRPFPEALLKISVNRPVAVFSRVGADPPSGVLVDHAAFTYQSLEEYMDISAGVNFRTLVNETIGRAGSAVTDHRFGAESLAGVNPDWKGGKRELLSALGRYTLYMLAAVESGILRPGGETAADASYSFGDQPARGDGEDPFDEDGCPAASSLPQPPSPVDRSGIMASLWTAPGELFYSILFGMAPFVSLFTRSGDFQNPLVWQTVTGISLLAAGIFLFPYSLLVLHYKRMVENTPTSRVRSMAMGIVELEGRARQYYDLKTSHSQTNCIYYRCRYYRLQKTGKRQQWRLMRETGSGLLPFYLEDATGRVLVQPRGARILVSKARQEFNGAESVWLPAHLRTTQTRIYEDLIAEGAKIYILGSARPERVGASVTERLVDRLRVLKSDPERMKSYDENGDGRIDVAEWEAARTDLEQQVYADLLMDGRPGEQVVIRKPLYGLLPFIIADTEEGIIRRLGFRVWTFMIGGLVMIGLGVELLARLMAS